MKTVTKKRNFSVAIDTEIVKTPNGFKTKFCFLLSGTEDFDRMTPEELIDLIKKMQVALMISKKMEETIGEKGGME
jgi:hypothetical protein